MSKRKREEDQTENKKLKREAIYSVGYGRSSKNDFVNTLKKNNIKTLVDIRFHPESSFSKEWKGSEMKEWLKREGIEYRWFVELGNSFHHMQDCIERFTMYLESNKTTCFKRLLQLEGKCAVMCACKDYTKCHRKIVANVLREQESVTMHNINILKKGQQSMNQFIKTK